MDGRQVLALIKEDDSLKTIPTVILTSSQAEADVVKSYQLQANCYLSKPMHFEAFHALVKSIDDFWLNKVRLPRRQDDNNEQETGPRAAYAPDRGTSREMKGIDEDHRRRRNAN
jgi:DNA-binding response OmpR family regulator